jgi:hypothetical protein
MITEDRHSIVEKEVEADTQQEAESKAAEMDGIETDNWLYDSTTKRLD